MPCRHGLFPAAIGLAVALLVGFGSALLTDSRTDAEARTTDGAAREARSVFDLARALVSSGGGDDAIESPPPARVELRSSAATLPARLPIPLSAFLDGSRNPQPLSIATPPLAPGDRILASVSFYYCDLGTADEADGVVGAGGVGDGGGFCGVMRDGSVVHQGAAACDFAYLGQRFRIVGDPTGRIYRCADTGSAVHGLHRDIWFPSSAGGWAWLNVVGRRAVIEIVE